MWIGILIIIGLVLYFTTDIFKNNTSSNHKTDAVNILKERFAKGEIDEEEYERKKQMLEN